ncbi:RNA polymerase sigma-70 factor, ECF subfamily [Chitinophaga ginsengisegetis]|uniref:RNA polymerase sigma-70 factor, ECF subfamily n=1 Tax=Chitinophaga ginsengisegetis TaxID=393003 RepID=A0A1T5NGP0_9BACT|nr:RNA polymerase sigma-70 factor [Chitinophaga ginsengisegetis]MDR6569416.1 RNA polymerase sigma-70 factor (ECF subfamily) [Chitinophaga ginsengisegetis]MDR6649149.1 RNA polymerase sigma-70 factor (ECF subfamily) [Chitinophaga ginsengisegetis]MDR6655499.1 RNA polymerase sigma-70 factor (ECF subfamily) [Chitinophaga ginsengisegetis]SKC99298.1 RNA polymerase sigma-70 factor, ECF subfamily [Chitinophaga ginsengisegetis]
MSNEEAVLLQRLQQGDTEAYITLYDQYYPSLYTYILHFINIPELAEDALQEVFIKIWEIRERINPELSFSGYLYRITRNHVFKLMKKISADAALRLQVMQELQQQTEDADTALLWKQYESLLHKAIAQLPPQRQKVFRLCREESKSYEEVAVELGISRNTVKEHMVLAMKSIKFFFYTNTDGILPLLLVSGILLDSSK